MGRDQHERDYLDAAEGEPSRAERLAKVLGADGGWIAHDGGTRPRLLIEVRLENGRTIRGRARNFRWSKLHDGSDIVAYRLLGPLPAALVKGD